MPDIPVSQPTPLDVIITRDHAMLAAQFAKGVSVARAALSTAEPDSSILITPLRGAMPIYWGAAGLEEITDGQEKPLPGSIEVPIGEFLYNDPSGRENSTSPSHAQKRLIIGASLKARREELDFPANPTVFILDEVQKGGTLTTAVSISRKVLQELDIPPRGPVNVIAAQDSRKKVMAQQKSEDYQRLAGNNVRGVVTTVIPMPLVSTDRSILLDTIRLEGDARDILGVADRLTVARNHKAEILFRALGSMARHAEVRHDPTFIASLIDGQGLTTAKASARVEDWFSYVVAVLDKYSLDK